MKRRDFIKSALAESAALGLGARMLQSAPQSKSPADPAIRRVLVMFKCHFDAGFIDTQAHVVSWYFERYYPKAIQTANELRQQGGDRYVWTTGSWLLYEYLEKAAASQREQMEKAIGAGDIAWHALPFSWQTELLEPSLIEASLSLSETLDRRFGRTTTGAKMTDVPGHTRGLIGPLASHGVKLVDIGPNAACTKARVPPVFRWRDPENRELLMMYHHDYGGVVKIPGSDLAIDIECREDNSGPHNIQEIHEIHSRLRAQFPNARVSAASLTDIANAVDPCREHLPVVTQEIADTWIAGAASDPLKVARYLEVIRLRREWIANHRFEKGDATDRALLQNLLLEIEHTWGADVKTWLDFDHYLPRDLRPMLDTPKYKVMLFSWAEKRQDLLDGIATLPAPLKAEATVRIRSLDPAEPAKGGLQRYRLGEKIAASHFEIALDPQTGAISRLRNKQTGRDWASKDHPLALFAYQTLSKQDFDRFLADYLIIHPEWAERDFGKPNIGRFGAESRTWLPVLKNCWYGREPQGHRIVAQLGINDPAAEQSGRVAWPQRIYLEFRLPDAETVVEVTLSWFDKMATRMPEALWLTFQPATADPHAWMLGKSGTLVSPFDVVAGGNRAMHAVLGGMHYGGSDGKLLIESLDAPVAALGRRHPWYFTTDQPDLAKGFHFNLFNNAWGTNYVQWFGENMRFRFRIKL